MIKFGIWQKAWAILEPPGRRSAWLALLVIVATGFLTAIMVASILPFLTVLADESAIERMPLLSRAYAWGGFASAKSFALWLGVGSLFLIMLATAAQIGRTYMIASFAAQQSRSISNRLFAAYLRQPYMFFLDRHTADLTTHILVLSTQAVDQFLRPAADVIAAIFTSLAILLLLLWVSPFMTIVCTLVLCGIYGLTFILSRREIARLAQEGYAANKERQRICIEAIGGIKAIKILNREESYIARFGPPSSGLAHAQTVTNVTAEVPNYVLQALAFGGVVALSIYLLALEPGSVQEALGNLLPVIGLLAFAGQRLLPELQRVYAGMTIMQHGKVAVTALYRDLYDPNTNVALRSPTGSRVPLTDRLEFDQITFRYPNTEKAGVFNLCFSISAGERIGLVGSTGAGKSTLANVLLGLFLPDSGCFRVDGAEVDRHNVGRWQQSLGYVPQDIFLTDASIAENVALGSLPEDIDLERVKTACRTARLSEMIENELPHGYATKVGERGVRLSGGQKQRIGIARAIYRDSDLLVFDEATSALDTVTEAEVMSAIDNLPGAKTVVLIAHRLSTVRSCDRIFLLDGGELVASGPWDDLLHSSKTFHNLATSFAE